MDWTIGEGWREGEGEREGERERERERDVTKMLTSISLTAAAAIVTHIARSPNPLPSTSTST